MTKEELFIYLESPELDKSITKYAKMVANKIITSDGFLRGATSQDNQGKTRAVNKKYPIVNLQGMVINIAKVFEYYEFVKDERYNEEPVKTDNKGFMEDFESFAYYAGKAGVKENSITMVRNKLSKWSEKLNSFNINKYPPDLVLERHLINEIRKYVSKATDIVIYYRVSELLNLAGIFKEPGAISRRASREKLRQSQR